MHRRKPTIILAYLYYITVSYSVTYLLFLVLIISNTYYKRNRASIIIFWKYENDGHVKKICPCGMHAKMPVLTVNMIFKFAPLVLKCIGANRNRAWIIHENEKYLLSWPKVRDLQWLSEGESYIYITVAYLEFVNSSRTLDRLNFVAIKSPEIAGISRLHDGWILTEKTSIEILILYILYCF